MSYTIVRILILNVLENVRQVGEGLCPPLDAHMLVLTDKIIVFDYLPTQCFFIVRLLARVVNAVMSIRPSVLRLPSYVCLSVTLVINA